MVIVWKMTLHLFAVFVILTYMIVPEVFTEVIKTETMTGV